MNLAVLGASGLVGSHVVREAHCRGWDVRGYTRSDAPLDDPTRLRQVAHRHDVVLNAAAYTAVDAAESDEATAFAVNALGARAIAEACADARARLVHLSTDYVFPGDATTPYPPTAAPGPRTAYGRTKLAGEWAIAASGGEAVVVRTAWLYGAGARNFPEAIRDALRTRPTLDVVTDQTGSPTWAHDLAVALLDLIDSPAPHGTYHLANADRATWFDVAQALCVLWGEDPARIQPTTSAAYARPASRPAWSVLDCTAAARYGVTLRPWRDALAAAHAAGVWGHVTTGV